PPGAPGGPPPAPPRGGAPPGGGARPPPPRPPRAGPPRGGGHRERALAIAKKALRILDEDTSSPRPDRDDKDSLRAAWFWLQRSNLTQDLDRGDGSYELGVAQKLTRGLPPSAVHAEVHSRAATWGALHRPGPEALAAADRAVEYARLVGAEYTELQARLTHGWLVADAGGVEDGLAEMYEVRERAEALGAIELTGRVSTNLPSTLESVGRSAEAVAAARAGIAATRSLGLAHQEAWTRSNLARSLFSLGRWDEAEAALDAVDEERDTPKVRGMFATGRAELALARGDLAEAGRQVERARAAFGTHDPQPQHFITAARLAMAIAGRQGRLADARAEFAGVAGGGFGLGTQRYALPLLVTAAAIEADHRGGPGAEEGRAAVLAAVGAHAKHLPAAVPVWQAYALMLDAERARAAGDAAPELWARASAAFEALDRPYELARARLRHAGALLETHADRGDVAALLAGAHAAARSLGARPLAEDVELLAGRARVTLGAPTAPAAGGPAGSLGLTPRERDVLRLVAEGLSNRGIAEKLYISPKTASVHVSNILAKLGVSGRTEAAATAHRLGLFT
ncbi:helix-turn-helix transcriptional regulator, partial [Streptomyces sp. 8L]|uniref:helix-turn-helix transcriptional regulator n=1 Tax=Streptomyces sp. 8L TaxID=2877242 RepID=UPI001CD6C294